MPSEHATRELGIRELGARDPEGWNSPGGCCQSFAGFRRDGSPLTAMLRLRPGGHGPRVPSATSCATAPRVTFRATASWRLRAVWAGTAASSSNAPCCAPKGSQSLRSESGTSMSSVGRFRAGKAHEMGNGQWEMANGAGRARQRAPGTRHGGQLGTWDCHHWRLRATRRNPAHV
jgi:hypothetical protein